MASQSWRPFSASGQNQSLDIEADWYFCCEWLKQEEITKNSVTIHDVNDVKSEEDLYLYLKYGVELNRIMGNVFKDEEIMEQIRYGKNTKALTSNMRNFISHVEKTTKLKIFTKHAEQTLTKFDHMPDVIDDLEKLSQKIFTLKNIPGFKLKKNFWGKRPQSKRQRDSSPPESDDRKEDYYSEQREYIPPYTNDTEIMTTEVRNVKEAIKELKKLNQSFLDGVLRIFKEEYYNKFDTFINKQLFPNFHIDELMELHQDLKSEFESLDVTYEHMLEIFKKYQDRFYIYCEVCSHSSTASRLMKDQVIFDENLENQIKEMDAHATRKYQNQVKRNVSLYDLIVMFSQHLMRYHLVLKQIKDMAEKGKYFTLQEMARKCETLMKDITTHVDEYVKDTENQRQIDQYPKKASNKEFGRLLKIYTIDSFMIKNENEVTLLSKSINLDMLVFENAFLFAREWRGMGGGILNEIKVVKLNSFRGKCRMIRLKHETEKNIVTLYLDSFVDTEPETSNSVIVKRILNDEGDRQKFIESLQSIIEEASSRQQDWRKDQMKYVSKELKKGDFNPGTCNSCKKLILGKIQEYLVHEDDPNHTVHWQCFLNSGPEMEDEFEDENSVINSLDDFMYPEGISYFMLPVLAGQEDKVPEDPNWRTSRAEAMAQLTMKVGGTFLLRYSTTGDYWVVSAKATRQAIEENRQGYSDHKIFKTRFRNNTYFYIEEGFGFRNPIDLLRHDEQKKGFIVPFWSTDADQYDPNVDYVAPKAPSRPKPQNAGSGHGEDQQRGDYWNVGETDTDEDEGEANNVSETLEFNDCYFGNIDNEKAEELLKDKPDHTFLFRFSQNKGHFYITYKDDGLTRNKRILSENKLFCIEKMEVKPGTQNEITAALIKDHWKPLRTDESSAKTKKGSIRGREGHATREQRRQLSQRREVNDLPYFHGTMDRKEAVALLKRYKMGSYLVRRNIDNEVIVSVKISQSKTSHHRIVMDVNKEFYVQTSPNIGRFNSLREAVESVTKYEPIATIPIQAS